MTVEQWPFALNPTWARAAAGFIRLGIAHNVTGYDHLLFLLCLVIPLRGWRQILSVITVFTVAHSFTLLGSAFNLAPSGIWFPPFVETAIAASIVYMAIAEVRGRAQPMPCTGSFTRIPDASSDCFVTRSHAGHGAARRIQSL